MIKTTRNTTNDEDEEFEEPLPLLDLARTEGFETFAERINEDDELARSLKDQWGVDDLNSEKGYQAWLREVHGVGRATTPGELLKALEDVPHQDDPTAVWKAVARLMGFAPNTASAEKILAGTVVSHLMDADEAVRGQIEEFFGALGEDLDAYDLELAREGGLALFGDPATDEPVVARTVQKDRIRAATATRLRQIKDGLVSGVRVDTAEQRSLDRLAWVLANLKASRECVAVVTMLENEIRLFANSADARLGPDFKRLFDAAMAGQRRASKEISAMFDEMVGQKLEVRVVQKDGLPADVLRRGERRLRKTLNYLASLEKEWDDLRVMTHEAARGKKIHAETQAGDVMLRQRAKSLGDQAGWSDDDDLDKREVALQDKIDDGRRARLSRRVADARIAIGISKLCCFKCWLMIQALRAKDINLAPSGTHAKTYGAGWPAPASLSKPSLLRAFLQIPAKAKDRTPNDEFLLESMKTADGRAAIITEIVSYTDKGQLESGYDSSEDESTVKLSLWKNYYGDDESSSEEEEVKTPVKKAAQPKKIVKRPVEKKPLPKRKEPEPESSASEQEQNDSSDDEFVATNRNNAQSADTTPRRSSRLSGAKLPTLVGVAYPVDADDEMEEKETKSARFGKRKISGGNGRTDPTKRSRVKKKK
ncbi:hypothetical protein [Herbidospora sp. RD11066]